MQYKTFKPFLVIKHFIYPPNVRQGNTSTLWMMGILYGALQLVGVVGNGDIVPEWMQNATVYGMLFVMCLFVFTAIRTLWLFARSRSDGQKIILSEEQLEGGFAILNYSGLRKYRPRDVTLHIMIGLCVTGMMLGLGYITYVFGTSESNGIARLTLGVLVAILVIPSGVYLVRYATRKKEGVGYEIFARDNDFSYQSNGTLEKVLGVFTAEGGINASKASKKAYAQFSGMYRGYSFTLTNVEIQASGLRLYGVLAVQVSDRYSFIPVRQAFEDKIWASPSVNSVAYGLGEVYCIIEDGMPADRAAMIELFQAFDALIEAEGAVE